jgi:hypothetical protein
MHPNRCILNRRSIALGLASMASALLIIPGPAAAQTLISPVMSIGLTEERAIDSGMLDISGIDATIFDRRKSTTDQADTWDAALGYVRRNHAAFRTALARTLSDPQHAEARVAARDSAYSAVRLALVAENPVDAADERAKVPSDMRTRVETAQRRLAEQLREARRLLAGFPFMVFASGTVTESLGTASTSEDDGAKPLGSGSLGMSVQTDAGHFTARVNVVSADNIADADIGPAVLSPGTGNALASGLMDFRIASAPRLLGIRGVHVPNHWYASASGLRLRDGTTEDAPIVRATVFGAGALWLLETVNRSVEQTQMVMHVEVGPSVRWIEGDVTRAGTISAAAEGYHTGLESGFSIGFGRVVAGAQLYYLWPLAGAEETNGLDGLQFVAGISVTGEFLRGTLRP